ncbi:MAG: hypothetical protein IPO72_18680 [Saprospiraceae bacterium]|nr:hypothetical protein [Candidatus Vicinibacter affinis]
MCLICATGTYAQFKPIAAFPKNQIAPQNLGFKTTKVVLKSAETPKSNKLIVPLDAETTSNNEINSSSNTEGQFVETPNNSLASQLFKQILMDNADSINLQKVNTINQQLKSNAQVKKRIHFLLNI